MTTDRMHDAERRVDRLLGLAAHAAAFVAVNLALFAQAGWDPQAGHFWGWGIGLAAHAVAVGPGASLKGRLVRQELERTGGRR